MQIDKDNEQGTAGPQSDTGTPTRTAESHESTMRIRN